MTSSDHAELVAARKRIAELENELAIHRRAAELLGDVVPPKRRYEATWAGMVYVAFAIDAYSRRACQGSNPRPGCLEGISASTERNG